MITASSSRSISSSICRKSRNRRTPSGNRRARIDLPIIHIAHGDQVLPQLVHLSDEPAAALAHANQCNS